MKTDFHEEHYLITEVQLAFKLHESIKHQEKNPPVKNNQYQPYLSAYYKSEEWHGLSESFRLIEK